MMKKLLVILLSMGLVFSLVACGSSSDSDDESDSKFERVDADEDEDAEDAEDADDADDADAGDEDGEEAESDKFERTDDSDESGDSGETVKIEGDLPYSQSYSGFYADLWYIYATSKERSESIGCAVDFTSEEIIRLGADVNMSTYEIYKYSLIEDNKIVDVTTGETLLELADNQELYNDMDNLSGSRVGWTEDGMCLVLETVEALEGNTYSIGVVNYKGEWVSESMTTVSFWENRPNVYTVGDGLFILDNGYDYYAYDCRKGSIESFPGHPARRVANKFYIERQDDYKLCVYDMETGAVTETARTYDEVSFWVKPGYFMVQEDDVVNIEGPSGAVSTFNMSKYSDNGYYVAAATPDKMFASVSNGEGARFACLFNTDGSMAFEEVNTEAGYSREQCYLTNEKLVAWTDNEILVYDIESGELVHEKEWPYSVAFRLPEKNMLIVQGEHPEYGYGYYLVDVNDVNTLINPFEKYECK